MGLGLAALTPVHAQAVKETDNREMTAMFDADQATRQSIDPAKPIDMTQVRRMIAEDAARRMAARAMLAEGRLKTAEDYYHAAFIFQHGQDAADYLLAHSLAMAAVARGKAEANWIAAATLDRYLMKIGQPQIYGTQYTRSKERGATMDPYDRALIPDSLRKALGVPVQPEQDKKLEAMKTAVPKP
ncbi:hypothetical protein SUS17_3487 [Sphingomonas sp. S17]|nr:MULTISPECIES: DUF6624 domain-containing protein [Sphingomonas]EGI53675.1 hypothetical protein SUS17_3487 [Sphingomonas sp. S17]RSU63189.1 hypothetical protein BRX36_16215 [Sphingomonas sp. S-NIH.Pt1_0416]MBQ1479590.1 hypothetical protein [Sphingomonas sp.]QBE92095.1 hypothetical protein DRN02_008710 [Sphingomonas paucimobilis]QPS17123.1 hypothetical protein I6G65_05695 [Sphingomonas paucimobilis]